jgi:hypothetical protein
LKSYKCPLKNQGRERESGEEILDKKAKCEGQLGRVKGLMPCLVYHYFDKRNFGLRVCLTNTPLDLF